MTMTAATPRTKTEDDITNEVLRRFDATSNPRLRQIMQSLVKHLHAFVRDVELTEAEWMAGIEFLTAVGPEVRSAIGRSSSCCRTRSASRSWSTSSATGSRWAPARRR